MPRYIAVTTCKTINGRTIEFHVVLDKLNRVCVFSSMGIDQATRKAEQLNKAMVGTIQ